MSWRVCRILDMEKHCTSVHSQEEMAKVETGSQLAALITKLQEDLPKYAGRWHYPRDYPGFVEDVTQTIDTVGALLQEENVWLAYDEWQHFMNRWEGVLHLPLWAQVGTIVVDGPGPTVEPDFRPMLIEKKRPRPITQPIPSQSETGKGWEKIFGIVSTDVYRALQDAGRPVPAGEIVSTIINLAATLPNAAILDVDTGLQWVESLRQAAFQHFGLTT